MEVIDNNPRGKTVRIHINTLQQPRPVVFNYRQLYKRELKKQEELPKDFIPPSALDANGTGDDFYEELLRKAERYAAEEDNNNEDDDDDDEENNATESKRGVAGDEYDYEDPFIDDSEMLLDEPYEYSAPEFDGFFVYHGPLDGQESDDKKPKRKAPAKPKNSTSTTTTNKRSGGANTNTAASTDKSRKKTTADDSQEESSGTKKKAVTNATINTTTPGKATNNDTKKKTVTATVTATNKTTPGTSAFKSTTATTSTASKAGTSTAKRTSSVTEQANKKKKKLEEGSHPISVSSSATSPEDTGDKAKKKVVVPPTLKPLDTDVEILMEKLRRDVKLESFENKAKFPISLKPTVLEIGLITFRKNRTIDDNLVFHLMGILPYNRFTLKKFLTTKSGQMRVDELQQEIDELAILLKQTIDRMMPEQRRLFNEKVAQVQASSDNANMEDKEPEPKFKCNDEVRKILYDIIQTEEQSIFIANQVALHKDSEKKSEGLASDNKARKLMYQRLLSCWPEGWMNSYEMSRQYSQYKTKMSALTEKKAAAAANNIPNTPKANIASVDNNNKKRKRVSDDNHPKKMADTGSNKSTPELPTLNSSTQKQPSKLAPSTPTNVITIDTDDDSEEPTNKPWNKSNSMKIESLISGPK